MEIRYLGHSSFFLKGKNASVVTDPYNSQMTGLKFPKHIEADIVTISHEHQDHNDTGAVEGSPFIVRGPGEYEIRGVSIIGVGLYHDDNKGEIRGKNTVYRIEIDGLAILHLGDLGHELTSEDIDLLDGIDILMIPVGGTFTIGPSQADHIISEIEPSIVLPMHYQRPSLNGGAFKELLDLSAFLKEIGKESVIPQPKLLITHDKLPPELQVVVLD